MDGTPSAARLASVFEDAHYTVHAAGAWHRLLVGDTAPLVESATGGASFGLLTAWNPQARPQSDAANRAADARLRSRLDERGLQRWPARAGAPDGGWREDGWLVADVDPVTLDRLAREFDQAAVLFWRRGAPVGLRMFRARPADAGPSAWVDWVE